MATVSSFAREERLFDWIGVDLNHSISSIITGMIEGIIDPGKKMASDVYEVLAGV